MKITSTAQEWIIDLFRGAWIVIGIRVDDDFSYDENDNPYCASYRVIRCVLRRLTIIFEWER